MTRGFIILAPDRGLGLAERLGGSRFHSAVEASHVHIFLATVVGNPTPCTDAFLTSREVGWDIVFDRTLPGSTVE